MIKKLYTFICLFLLISSNSYADSYKTISYINEISEAVKNADQDTLVVFDVDNVISAPIDLIGRPKAHKVRRAIFKEYEQKYGKERVQHINSLYYIKVSEEFVEPAVKEIIIKLQERQIPSLALTAIGTKKFGSVEDPMCLRVSRLQEKGVDFSFANLDKRILWEDEAGYESGVIFSGKQSKGEALQYFLENIIKWKPIHIIFIDDNLNYLNSVHKMCDKLEIEFTGFHYKAAIFDEDKELSPDIARLQIKTLDEQQVWIPDHKLRER